MGKAFESLPPSLLKTFQKNIKKPLDKPHKMCYNKDVPKRERKNLGLRPTARKEPDIMAKKMTIKEMLVEIAKNPTLTDEQKAFLLERAEKSVKKASAERKPTKTQEANDVLRAEIFESMESGVKYTISDMIKNFPCCADLSNQKVTAVIKPLIDNGITKVVEGRKTYFVKG